MLDLIIIGAGPAVGRKLPASGGGRCNITNTLTTGPTVGRKLPSLSSTGA